MLAAHIRREYKMQSSGDSWGDCMGALFDVAAEMWWRGVEIPAEWRYRPGMAGDPREPESAWYDACGAMQDDELAAFGAVLERYSRMLKHAGREY